MKVTHRQEMITLSIARGRRYLNFYAWPMGTAKNIDFYNWRVDIPDVVSKEYGKNKISNYGFKSINEIEEYVKRFENPGIDDTEECDLRLTW